jgi:diaminopimelate decarboxylase
MIIHVEELLPIWWDFKQCFVTGGGSTIVALQFPPCQIPYGNPCRPSSQLQYAVHRGVKHLSSEGESELRIPSANHRSAE